ncbi:disease resistance protein RPV1-like [Corylus avellana]|uniref:disease resistance protein RPV1-like n=1 Tax=Corylus avellana TaxID=13451 RepID=UPI00286AA7CE|nr:disease resistance protein RPV1-like [Corylus avellana]
MKKLGHDKALKLFSWHAFNTQKPDNDYGEVTKAVNIFLDIACFFKGKNVEYVIKILDSTHGFHSYSGIEELKDRCLVTQSNNKSLKMHNLIQEMGREIVRQESLNEPGNRSRLWFHEDVRDVLERDTGTNKVEGILIHLPKPGLIHLSPNTFKKMKKLRMFENRNACFSEEPNFLSNELRLLDWYKYPGESLPSNFCGKNLVVLRMRHSQLKDLEGVQNFQNTTIMNFSHCKFLQKIHDVSRIPNLQKLILTGCTNLIEVHHSVGSQDKLVSLRLKGCSNLMSFPRSLKMRSLKFLSLQGCLKLKNFPEIQCQMECLKKIDFRKTGIKELPSSIGYLVGIKTLNLSTSAKLTDLPDSIHKLQHLEILNIGGGLTRTIGLRNFPDAYHLVLLRCSKVAEFFKVEEDTRHSMPTVVSMEESATSSTPELLQLSPLTDTSDSNDGCSSILFPKLQMLAFINCDLSESNIFRTFYWFSTLTILVIAYSDIVTLPPCIRRFVRLKHLYLIKCKQLREILGLPPNVGTIFPALILGNNVLPESDFLIQRDCPSSLKVLKLLGSAIVSLPVWLNRFAGLEQLYLGGCKQLREIPELPPTLQMIDLFGCHGLHENIGGQLKDHEFGCIFVGNKIPDWFNHCKEVSNANSCEIDIDEPVHLDLENTRFSFSAVIGTNDVQVEVLVLQICVEVINNGQRIIYRTFTFMHNSTRSDNVWLQFLVSHRYQLKMDNLRVKFTCKDQQFKSTCKYNNFKPSKSMFFKSCGFHLEHIYEEKAIDIIDDIQLSKTL